MALRFGPGHVESKNGQRGSCLSRGSSMGAPAEECFLTHCAIAGHIFIPVVPHKAVAEVSKIGNL